MLVTLYSPRIYTDCAEIEIEPPDDKMATDSLTYDTDNSLTK
jgi:hypothetical protein